MNSPRFEIGDDQVMTRTRKPRDPKGAPGRKTIIRLSHTAVLALAPCEARYLVWDDFLKGFGVRVEGSGRKFFFVRYRAHGGGRRAPLRQMSIGEAGTLSCAAARKQAEGILALAKLGGDPAADRADRRQGATIGELIDFYLGPYAASANLRESTVRDAKWVLTQFVLPSWRSRRVEEITVPDARALYGAVLKQKGAHQANRMQAYLSSAFTRAMENGWRTDNPFRLVKKAPQDVRTRILSESEITRLLQALERLEDQKAANAIRILLFTGARLNEVLKASWDQFNLEKGLWVKPSAHTKQKRLHRVALGREALAILRRMRELDPNGDYLFTAATPDAPRFDLKRPWNWVRREAGIGDVRSHDLRRTLGSYMAMGGHSSAVVGSALGHTQAATTARYMAIALGAQQNALEQIGKHFTALGAQPALFAHEKNSARLATA